MMKRYLGALLLLLVLVASFQGQYIKGILIFLVMTIVPFASFLGNYERLEYTKGKKICNYNFYGVLIFLTIIDILNYGGIYDEVFINIGSNAFYGVICYFINKLLFVYGKKEKRTIKSTKKQKVDKEEKVIKNETIDEDILKDEFVEKKHKARFCKLCGGQLNYDKKCTKCGKQYFKLKKYLFLIILMTLFIISLIGNICQYIEYEDLYWSYVSETDELYWKNKELEEKANFLDENIYFDIEGLGKYYYTYDCMKQITNGTKYRYRVFIEKEAISEGYKPASCNNINR